MLECSPICREVNSPGQLETPDFGLYLPVSSLLRSHRLDVTQHSPQRNFLWGERCVTSKRRLRKRLPVSRLESDMSKIISEVHHILWHSTFTTIKFHYFELLSWFNVNINNKTKKWLESCFVVTIGGNVAGFVMVNGLTSGFTIIYLWRFLLWLN